MKKKLNHKLKRKTLSLPYKNDTMQLEEVISKFQEIFIDILDNEDITLSYETTASDVEEWDSLTHIQLVVGIEKYFKVKFTTSEIEGFKNVGEMCESILKKVNH